MDGADVLQVGLLGPLEVRRAGVPVGLTSATQRLILARLAIATAPVSEDQLVDAIWGDRPPASAATSLRAQVSRLRTALRGARSPAAVVVHGSGGYRLETGVEIDVLRFEDHVAAARAAEDGDPAAARRQLALALRLWRGEVLAEFRFEPFAQPTIARLEALRLGALEARIALDLRAGRAGEIIPELEALSREHPLRERLSELLVTALAQDDRVPEALAAYRRVTTIQREELGLGPSRRLQRLHRDLVLGDADDALAAGSPGADPVPSEMMTEAWRTVVGTVGLSGASDDVRLDLLLVRADRLRRSGRGDDARHSYAAAVQLATSLELPDRIGTAVLGLVGPPEDSITGVPLDEALVERSLLRLPTDHPVLPRLQARLAVALIDRGDHTRGWSLLDTALAASRDAGDRAGVAYALRARHRSWFDPCALPERLASASELLRLGRELDDGDVAAWGHRWRFIGLMEGGALEEAAQELDALDAIADQLSDAFHRWFVVVRRAGLGLLTRPADEAHAAVLDAVALTDRMPSPYTMVATMMLLWSSHVLQGRTDEALDLAEQLAGAQVGLTEPLLAWSAAAASDVDRARAIFDELATDGFAAVLAEDHIRVLWLLNLTALAETACLLDDRGRAVVLSGLLAPFAGRSAVVHPGVTVLGTVDDRLERLAALTR